MQAERSAASVLVDSHCHLDLEQFDSDREEVLERSEAAGVGLLVNPGIDLEHSQRAVELAETHTQIFAAVGVHPNSSGNFQEQDLARLRRLAAHPKVVAIGEIGLDYYWDTVPSEVQAAAFQAQLDLASELGLPVIIHNRDADEDVANILEAWVQSAQFRRSPLAQRAYAGVLHAFNGDLEFAERAYEWRFILGIGGPVTFKNAHSLHRLIPNLRMDRLMVETDAPYLTPHPHRGRRNEPQYVSLVAQRLAELLDQSMETVARTTTAVAAEFFQVSILS